MNAQATPNCHAQQIVHRTIEAHPIFSRILRRCLVNLGAVALIGISASTLAATAPSLGTAQSFAVLGASAVTNTGSSVVSGDLGISPNGASSVTGFPPGIIAGTTHYADGVALQAQSDTTTAYNSLASQPCNFIVSADLGGTTLTPGVYCSASSMGLTGTVTLDAQGDANAVFVFRTGSTLTTGSNAKVNMINSGQSCNVYWQVGSSATLGTGTSFAGNILALASITLTTGAGTNGRLLARTGAVTLDGSAVSVCSLAAVPGASIPPTLGKTFSPSITNAGTVSTLTVNLSNPAATLATLTSPLVDTLPSGVVIAATPSAATTCGGSGAPLAVAGGSSLTLPAGRTIPASGSCTVTVNVTAAAGGSYINTLPAGALVTNNGNNTAPAVATLTIVSPIPQPTLGKAFSPSTINAGAVSTLTVTLSNPHVAVATLTSALVDTLPTGVVIAATPSATTTCSGTGTPIAVAGSTSITLPAGRSIPATGSCTLTVNVSAAAGGSYTNTLPAGALVTSAGINAAAAIATLTVVPLVAAPPSLSKAFSPASLNAGGVSTLTVTLSNPNATAATLTAPLIDTLPSGVVIAATPSAATTCGGGTTVAVAGSNSVTLQAGSSIPANGSCTLTVNVTAAIGGSYINTLPAGALATSNGSNASPAIATLTVVSAVPRPTLGKAFDPATINAGGISVLTVTLINPAASIATLTAALSDNLPSGVVIATSPNATTTCGGTGTPVAVAGTSSVTLPAGRSIPASSSCTLTVNVTATVAGSYINTLLTGSLVTSNGNNAAPAVATLTVVPVSTVIPTQPGTTPVAMPNNVPTLSEWAMMILVGLLSITGFAAMRRQNR